MTSPIGRPEPAFPILARMTAALCLGAGLALAAVPAAAHVTIRAGAGAEAGAGPVKAGQVATFVLKIPHGCAGAATTGLRVAVPAVLSEIAPQEKPGWSATVSPAGAGNASSVLAWSGGTIPASDHAEFAFRAQVAADARGRIAVPVVQQCGAAVERWIETPTGETSGHSEDAGKPAPAFDIGR